MFFLHFIFNLFAGMVIFATVFSSKGATCKNLAPAWPRIVGPYVGKFMVSTEGQLGV